MLNPFRWKSQYIDSDTGLYYISKRWYDPECGRFINAASPECLLDNASVVFALNLYAFAIENPIAVILACGSIYPSLDFFYEGPAPWWENAWNWVLFGLGVLLTIAAAIIAGVAAGPGFAAVSAVWLTLKNITVATVAGAALSLTIGGTIAGLQGAMTGHAFWSGFLRYAKTNAAEALISSFAVSAASVAIGNAINALKCFKEGTPVVTEAGLKPIEEVKVGDKVLAYDEHTGEQAYKKVVRLFRNKTDEWYHITANGEEIVCTGGHPFYVLNASEDRNAIRFDDREETNGKWITAKELKKDDKLLLSDGSYGIIKSIKVEKLSKPETTYNFEVEDFHTYFVGESEVLVHNACGAKSATLEQDLYRGGNDMTLKNGEYRLDSNNLVKTTHGLSVNADPNAVAKFGGAYKIQSLPNGLKVIQRGQNLLHFEIVPQYAMTLEKYQSLLYQVVLVKI